MIIVVQQKSGLYEIVERRVVARVVNFNLPVGIQSDEFTVKGGLLVGTGAGTHIEQQPGTNGQVLMYDSAEVGGVKAKTLSMDDIASTMKQWVALGLPTDSVSAQVNALAYDATNNMVYLGGDFLKLGGVSCAYVSRFNLTTRKFESIGGSLDGTVYAIAISGDNVFVGGTFTNYLKKYAISSGVWTSHGASLAAVDALAISGDTLYVGGNFTGYIKKFTISSGTLAALSGSIDGSVNTIAIDGDTLYVGGYMTGYVTRYSISGGTWSVLSGISGMPGSSVQCIVIVGDKVFIMGNYIERFAIYSIAADVMTLMSGYLNMAPLCAAALGDELYIGGLFYIGAGLEGADYFVAYNHVSDTWRYVGTFDGAVTALCVVGDNLMAGGSFDTINGVKTRMAAIWYARLDSTLETLNAQIVNAQDINAATLSGTYTPTLTNVTNIALSVAGVCQYMQVGNVVTVSGNVNIAPTATGAVELGVSLPVASDFTLASQLGGTAAAAASWINQSLGIIGDVTNNRARFMAYVTDTGNRLYGFSFTYLVM